MKCKLTGKEGKGVNAHIIPKSFYGIDPNEPLPTKLITNAESEYTKRSPQGIYDKTIVIAEGEKVFDEWDNYAAELLINQKHEFEPLSSNGNLAGYQFKKYDYKKLKLFCLSVLWRASVSRHDFFKKVNLGIHEEKIRKTLLSGDPQGSGWYSVCIAKWSDNETHSGMMDPFMERYFGVNYYRFYIGNYIVYFKVDKRIAGEKFRGIQLMPNSPLIVVARKLKESKEYSIMLDMVKKDIDRVKK
jgi:hypothetical protein